MKKMRLLVLILLSAMLLSSCITLRVETKIKQDGSGTKSFVVALDKSVMSMVESMADEADVSSEDIWAEARASAETITGAKVEEYSDEDSEGIKISVPFENLDELEALSNSDAFEETDTVTTSKEGDTTTLRATVNVGDLASGLGGAGGSDLEGFDFGEIEIEYTYTVDVEGEIVEYSPQDIAEVKGGRVTWDLSQATAQTIDLMVKWKPGGGSNTLVTLLIVVVAGGAILAVAGFFLMARSRRSPDQVEMG